MEEYTVMSTEPYRTDFRNRTIEFYQTESNDRCWITEPDRIVIELYRKIFSSIKVRLLTYRSSILSSISDFVVQAVSVIASATALA